MKYIKDLYAAPAASLQSCPTLCDLSEEIYKTLTKEIKN